MKWSLLILLIFFVGCSTTEKTLQKAKLQEAAEVNIQLGIQYLQQGDRQKALEKFTLALKQAPRSPAVYNALGFYMEKVEEADKAEQYYKQALSLNSREASTQNNYGTFLCRQKRYPEAIKLFLKATSEPLYSNAAKAYENAGLCALEAKNPQARTFFEKALAHDPKTPSALLGLAEFHYQGKDFINANYYLQRFLEVSTPSYRALDLGVKINQQLKNKKELIYYQEQLAKNFPDQKLTQ